MQMMIITISRFNRIFFFIFMQMNFIEKETICTIKPLGYKTTYPSENYNTLTLAEKFDVIGENLLHNKIILRKC